MALAVAGGGINVGVGVGGVMSTPPDVILEDLGAPSSVRSFLARAQTEGYLSGSASNPHQLQLAASGASKIIRPIPSKATLPNFGFLPAPPPTIATAAAYVQQPVETVATAAAAAATVLDQLPVEQHQQQHLEDEEDVEVFIDSNTATDNELELELDTEDCNVSVVSSLASSSAASSLNIERVESNKMQLTPPASVVAPTAAAATTTVVGSAKQQRRSNSNSQRKCLTNKRNNSTRATVASAAKAPPPAAQLETATQPSKFIIDVASCDGPVRFRRILNTAYGHKPDTFDPSNGGVGGGGSSSGGVAELQRTQQSVSYSFHQQMARAISSQQRQQQQVENENTRSVVDIVLRVPVAVVDIIDAEPINCSDEDEAAGTKAGPDPVLVLPTHVT
ncbi:uncharacterized protein LOC6565151 [Drosophila grimshawi]|uniref:uncharacterized protein LOC6565151 n=1 Tax=Drosophila grimshawi TaxID=7222 RepID=UPI001C934338|nr:uncharacterized protein LOC6565151 [Drosophila grimshawi]